MNPGPGASRPTIIRTELCGPEFTLELNPSFLALSSQLIKIKEGSQVPQSPRGMQGISSEALAWRVPHGFLETSSSFFFFCKGQFILQTTWVSAISQRQTGSCKPPGTWLKVSRFSRHYCFLSITSWFSEPCSEGPRRPPE